MASKTPSPALLEAAVTGTLTPLDAALLCERVEQRGMATVADVQVLFSTADHLNDQVEEYRHALRVLAVLLEDEGLYEVAAEVMVKRGVSVMP